MDITLQQLLQELVNLSIENQKLKAELAKREASDKRSDKEEK